MVQHTKSSFLLLFFAMLVSVTAQTFQYSRGWGTGKRDGSHDQNYESNDVARNLEKFLSPCQMNKLKYLLSGKPYNEKTFAPCDYVEDEELSQKRYKMDHSREHIFDFL